MRTSTQYKIFDHKENKVIATEATLREVVDLTGIPYTKVSLYSINGYKFNKRYSVEKVDIVLDMIMDDLFVTLMGIKNTVSEDRFHNLKFVKKKAERVS